MAAARRKLTSFSIFFSGEVWKAPPRHRAWRLRSRPGNIVCPAFSAYNFGDGAAGVENLSHWVSDRTFHPVDNSPLASDS